MWTDSSMHKTPSHMLIMVPHSTDSYTKNMTFHSLISSVMLETNCVKQMKQILFIDWRNLKLNMCDIERNTTNLPI